MGLFDNIFLDQNSATVMLDPLSDNKKNLEGVETKKAIESTDVAEPTFSVPEAAIDTVSFDDIQLQKDTVTEQPKGFLSGSDPTLESPDDISFDIGGLDMSSFSEDQSSASLSSDIPVVTLESDASIPDTIIMDTVNLNQEVTDSSIALVQGATAASSDTIIDNITPISIDETDSGNKIDTLVIDDTNVSNDVLDSMIIPPSSEGEESSGIMGLFSTDVVPTTVDTPSIPPLETVSPEGAVVSLGDNTDGNISDNVSGSLESVDMNSPLSEEISHDIIHRATDTHFASSDQMDSASPLQEMLMEFVSKLEKFNTESSTLDTEMVSVGAALIQEEQDLKREYDIRMNAIQYKRKHMEETRAARQVEKTRLERIIANLKQEIR